MYGDTNVRLHFYSSAKIERQCTSTRCTYSLTFVETLLLAGACVSDCMRFFFYIPPGRQTPKREKHEIHRSSSVRFGHYFSMQRYA